MNVRKYLTLVVSLLWCLGATRAEDPLYATFSIVARDAATGDLGVAVTTKAPAVGSVVPWARAGVGAVATQAWTNPGFGPRGLELLQQGLAPEDVIGKLLSEDSTPEKRQVAVIDARGGNASHTGKESIVYAGAISGENFSVQGNLLAGAEVLVAMARSFSETESRRMRLTERLLLALEAGQAAGGDKRGRQSAALLVVSSDPERKDDRSANLRVDDHEQPVRELRRLHDMISGKLGHRELSQAAGPDVRELQELLAQAGLYATEPTGVFDDDTAAAVQAFRKVQGMYAGELGGARALVDADLLARLGKHIATRKRAAGATGGP